jgi:hypothetical protein
VDFKLPVTAFLNGRDVRLLDLLQRKYLAAVTSASRRVQAAEGTSTRAGYPERVAELFVEECFLESLEARRRRPRWRAAIRAYRRLLEHSDEEAPDLLFLRAHLLYSIGRDARALHLFRHYLRRETRPGQRPWQLRAARLVAALRRRSREHPRRT